MDVLAELEEEKEEDEVCIDCYLHKGVLTIEVLADERRIVINKHSATKQILYSSPYAKRYFDPPFEQVARVMEKDVEKIMGGEV
eukprot:CAMPEP_0172698444 /NCGR_PEP_ID=MMETSP1074-20121228/29486_1 /TAXON_ID=2916 /ORGANISM="Ceratium fusus, Strain PA161109" /LENGTH=83 /DNA_ID=CAMNT_0013519489 /DNA_START=410 /DNA_END=661 /DNA_ORIENTATION=-